jgi:hypothetical protein
MNFLREKKLSQAASDLIAFDADSIRQVVSSRHSADPDVWVVDPEAYEKNGRLLRDSESPRMLAYSRTDRVLYATDGCNSCARRVSLRPTELKIIAEDNEIRLDLLERLASLINDGS